MAFTQFRDPSDSVIETREDLSSQEAQGRRDIFDCPRTTGTGERVPDQPGRERPGDLVEFHTTNEPGGRDQ